MNPHAKTMPEPTKPSEPTVASTAAVTGTGGAAPPSPGGSSRSSSNHRVSLEGLSAYYGDHHVVKDINLAFEPSAVTAIIGPSGCGKSTMVRCVNRMHEEIPGAHSEGRVTLDGIDLHGSGVDVVAVRRAVGMVFQKPNPFPTMSIFDNVAAGLRFTGTPRDEVDDRAR